MSDLCSADLKELREVIVAEGCDPDGVECRSDIKYDDGDSVDVKNELAPVKLEAENDDQPQTIVEFNLSLLRTKILCDVVFTFEKFPGERIEAHQVFLRGRSPVFDLMLRDRKINGYVMQLKIEDTEPRVFRKFLEFVYADKFDVDLAGALALLPLAYKYKVKPLLKKCEEKLKADLEGQISLAVKVLEAGRNFELPELAEVAGNVIVRNFKDLVDKAEFLNMEETTLNYLLKKDDLAVREVVLFNFVHRWAQKRTKVNEVNERKEILRTILPLIRFPTMTPNEFATVVVPSGLLNQEDVIQLLTFFISDNAARANLVTCMNFSIKPRNCEPSERTIYFYSGSLAYDWKDSQCGSHQLKESFRFRILKAQNIVAALNNKSAVITGIMLVLPRVCSGEHEVFGHSTDLKFVLKILLSYGEPLQKDRLLTVFETELTDDDTTEIQVEPPVKLMPEMSCIITVEDQMPKGVTSKKKVDCPQCAGRGYSESSGGNMGTECIWCESGKVWVKCKDIWYYRTLVEAGPKSNLKVDFEHLLVNLGEIEVNSPVIVPTECVYDKVRVIRGIRLAMK